MNQRLRIFLPPPTHTRTHRQARPVHVARARARTRSTRNRSPASREREGRHGGGGRRAQLYPQVSIASRSSLFLLLAAHLRRPALPRFALRSSTHDDWGREGCGGVAANRAAVPCRFSRDAFGEFNACLIFGWWNRAGKEFPCVFFPLLLPFGSSDWHTTVQHKVDKDLVRCAPPSGKAIFMGVRQPSPSASFADYCARSVEALDFRCPFIFF